MAKEFRGRIKFDQPPDIVFDAQCDAEYVAWKHENMAAFDISAEVEEDGEKVRISSGRKLPAVIPSAAKKFVGESITVDEVHTWRQPDASGSYQGTVEASFGGAPMAVEGTLDLNPDGTGSVLEVYIKVKASVPLVGGKLEQIVGDQFMRALNKEQEIAPRWFSA